MADRNYAPSFPDAKHPLFVSLKKTRLLGLGTAALRGCIGTLGPISIYQGLWTYARSRCAAVRWSCRRRRAVLTQPAQQRV